MEKKPSTTVASVPTKHATSPRSAKDKSRTYRGCGQTQIRFPQHSASWSYPITALTCYNSLNEQSATFHLRHWLHSKPLDRSFLSIFLLRICTPLPLLEFLPCVSLERMQGNSRMHVDTLSSPFPSVWFQGLAARQNTRNSMALRLTKKLRNIPAVRFSRILSIPPTPSGRG